MLASITRLIFVAWFAVLAALLACGARYGWPVGVWIGLYVLVLGHPTILAAEFVMAHRIGRRAGIALSPAAQMRAWLGEWAISTVVFGWRMPWRSNTWPDHLPRSARGLRGVVFIHGYICNRGIWNPWLKRLTKLDRAFVAVTLEPVFGDIDAYADTIERAVRRVEYVTGLAPVIVAHSMGGIVARAWLRTREGHAASDGHEHAARVITIATPHRGTWLAGLAMSQNARQMRTGGAWMEALGRAETPEHAAMFTSWWSECDQIVFPPPTGTLAGSESHQVRGVAHVALTAREEIWAELRRRIEN